MFIVLLLYPQELIVKQNAWRTCQLFLHFNIIYNKASKIILRVFMKYFSCSDLQQISNYLTTKEIPSSKKDFFNALVYLTEGGVAFISDRDLEIATGLHIRTIYRHLEYFKNLEMLEYENRPNFRSNKKYHKREIKILLPTNVSPQNIKKSSQPRTITFSGTPVNESCCTTKHGAPIERIKLINISNTDKTLRLSECWISIDFIYNPIDARAGKVYFKASPYISNTGQLLLNLNQSQAHG